MFTFLSWKTDRKIIVIESDDWGSIRLSSKEAYEFFLKKGYPVDANPYDSNDSLESNDDLELLFDVLSSVKDKYNNSAIMTANNITSNPDFKKIKADNFQNYYHEPFTETLKTYPNHDRVYGLNKEGIKNKVFKPQFHGREHINVRKWLRALQTNNEAASMAFEKNMFTVNTNSKNGSMERYTEAFGSSENSNEQQKIIVDGLNLFERLWGFKSKSFVAPCYTWDSVLEKTLFTEGVKYLQGITVQTKPTKDEDTHRKKSFHYLGQKNKLGQRYLVRNAFFEPTLDPNRDFIDDCLGRIEIAFNWSKPVIIGTHRLNFIGNINPQNRDKNLKLFSKLLQKIKNCWEDVEFMSSDMLGTLIDFEYLKRSRRIL
jgi:hypothetical protein